MDAFLWPHIDQNRAILPRLPRRVEARGPRRVDAPDKTRPVSCSSGRSRQLAPDPVLARAASALKAPLALGKLYQSTDRLAEADAVFAAALSKAFLTFSHSHILTTSWGERIPSLPVCAFEGLRCRVSTPSDEQI